MVQPDSGLERLRTHGQNWALNRIPEFSVELYNSVLIVYQIRCRQWGADATSPGKKKRRRPTQAVYRLRGLKAIDALGQRSRGLHDRSQ